MLYAWVMKEKRCDCKRYWIAKPLNWLRAHCPFWQHSSTVIWMVLMTWRKHQEIFMLLLKIKINYWRSKIMMENCMSCSQLAYKSSVLSQNHKANNYHCSKCLSVGTKWKSLIRWVSCHNSGFQNNFSLYFTYSLSFVTSYFKVVTFWSELLQFIFDLRVILLQAFFVPLMFFFQSG